MEVTVAICTWNRAELLDVTLSSLAELEIPPGVVWKVLVADNNSNDDTPDVVAAHRSRLPLEYLFVEQQGKSSALNAVVERLTGDLVLWTDDDVLPSEQWLASYVRAARRHPEIGFFGGPIIPRFLGGEPDWLRPAWKTVAGLYGHIDHGPQPLLLDKQRLAFGGNWAARVPLHKQYRYDLKLGRRGELLLAGEETDLLLRMLADGHLGLWTPSSSIEHLVTPERTEIEALRRYLFCCGECRTPARSSAAARLLCGAVHAGAGLICEAIGALCSPTARPDLWVKYLMFSHCSWGHVEGHWKDFPQWLKPPAVRRLLERRRQPGPATTLKPLLEGLRKQKAAAARPRSASAASTERRAA